MPDGNYGLARNSYVDERFDPEKSTRAYARYMKYIYYASSATGIFPWPATTGARATCSDAVEKTGYADFWELYKRNNLPGETKNYVPEILAAIIIANHPTQYGFDDITLDPPVLTDTVTINYSADLRLVSDIVGAPVDELIALNPSLLRMVTPPDTDVRPAPARRNRDCFRGEGCRDPREQAEFLALPQGHARRYPGHRGPHLPRLCWRTGLGERPWRDDKAGGR